MRLTATLVACLAVLAVAACSEPPPPPPPAPPRVTAMNVIQRTATIKGDAVGEVRAVRTVELRPQVTGRVQRIAFEPGQRVKEGQLLFVIDPRPYEAAVAQELAALADAQSTLARARQDVARYKALLPHNAIPRATYDAAVAAVKSAEAAVEQRQAAIRGLRLDLQNTEVRSPITGQIGRQQVEVGALATAGQTVLATVSTLDPVYVDFSISEAEYIRYVRGAPSREAAAKQARSRPIELILPDGTLYPERGTFAFAEPAISGTTGTLGLRAQFPNPDNLLRPGMNVRVRVIYDEIPNALLVPQRAVTELLDKQFVTVIGPDNRAEQRLVELGERVGQFWIVKSGLKPGERIIVDGTQKAPPGTVVAPEMLSETEADRTAKK